MLSARELARTADPSLRALVENLARETLALIAEVEAAERTASSTGRPSPPTASSGTR
jgi:hypothetical protein